MNELGFEIEQLEERIAPCCCGSNYFSGNNVAIGVGNTQDQGGGSANGGIFIVAPTMNEQ